MSSITALLAEPPVRERLAAAGVDASTPSTLEAAHAFPIAEQEKFSEIVRLAGLALG